MTNIKLYSRNGVLYIDYLEFGKRIRRSLNLQDSKANREYAIRNIFPNIEKRLRVGIDSTLDLRLEIYVDKFLKTIEKPSTLFSYEIFVKEMFNYLNKDKNITDFSIVDIDNVIDKMEIKGLSPATIRAYFAPIRGAFNLAFRQGLIDKNPVIMPKFKGKVKEEIKPYDLFEVANLLNTADERLRAFLYFAFYTGARSGEILALTWGDIKDDEIIISKTINNTTGKIGTPKNGKTRKIFILKQLKVFIDKMERGDEDERVFDLSYLTFLNGFKGLCQKLGYKPQGLHSMRHTFISLCVASGVELPLIQKMVGHSNLNMIMEVYTHYIDDSHKKKQLEKAFDTADTALTHQKLG